MKYVALGGCGDMARFAVQTALNFDFVEQIIVADRDGATATEFAGECGPRVGHTEIDVRDESSLLGLLQGVDAVLNDVGPYFKFGPTVLQAAIEAKCNYVDLNDDWEATVEMLDLDEPLTLPRYHPDIKNSYNVMVASEAVAGAYVREVCRAVRLLVK